MSRPGASDRAARPRGGAQRIPRPPDAAPGAPAPWAHLPAADRAVDLATLAGRVAARGPGRPWIRVGRVPEPGRRPSAVLVALYEERREPVVVLTKRATSLRANPGEIAFPGGRQDPGETPVATALREAWEETALDPALPVVIGELDHLTTVTSRAFIVPVVARLPDRPELVPAADEVAAVYHVPLAELLDDGVYREERWGSGPANRPVWFFELEGETVWGATAAMLRQLLVVALGLESDRQERGA